MTTPWKRAVIGIGSNLGDRSATIASARAAMDADPHIRVVANSSLYRSAAVRPEGIDATEAPEYLNAVTIVQTEYEPHALLDALLRIERNHGRERSVKWGDRTLDLDILQMEDSSVLTDDLQIPHPLILDRPFVCVPWAEVEPGAMVGSSFVRDFATQPLEVFIEELAR